MSSLAYKYETIADSLRQDIKSGKYTPGELMPDQNKLAETFDTPQTNTSDNKGAQKDTRSDKGAKKGKEGKKFFDKIKDFIDE